MKNEKKNPQKWEGIAKDRKKKSEDIMKENIFQETKIMKIKEWVPKTKT